MAARHSFSTVLKRSGASIEFISESLGHSNLKTTENYLDSFEDETRKKYSDVLTNFSTR
jgi:site-specific recombinase XerD